MKLWSQKKFFVHKFSLPPNITFPNGNALDWNLWRKIRWLKLDKHGHQNSNRFFNQNYTNFYSYYYPLIPPTKQVIRVMIFIFLFLTFVGIVYWSITCTRESYIEHVQVHTYFSKETLDLNTDLYIWIIWCSC